MAQKPPLRGQDMHLVEIVPSCRVGLEKSPNQRGLLLVNFDSPQAWFVHIAQRRLVRIDSPPNFLPHSAPHIFRERIHIIFRLPERHIENKFSLRRVFEPKRGKFQGRELARVHQPDNPPAIDRVARKAVGMPRQERIGLPFFYPSQHVVEDRPPRLLGCHGFHEFKDDFQPLLAGKLAQLVSLRINRKNLPLFVVRALPRIKEYFHFRALLDMHYRTV